jgi:uncharacterized membrane protein
MELLIGIVFVIVILIFVVRGSLSAARSVGRSVGQVVAAPFREYIDRINDTKTEELKSRGHSEKYVQKTLEIMGLRREQSFSIFVIFAMLGVIILVCLFPPSGIFLLFWIVFSILKAIQEIARAKNELAEKESRAMSDLPPR